MARVTGQIVSRGRRRWLVRVYRGRDRQTRQRRYLSRTVHGPARRAQESLTKTLRERDLGRGLEGTEITLDEFLDRCLDTAAKPKLREKSYGSYESLLQRYIRQPLGARILSTITPLDMQDACQKMIDRGLSSRTVRYTYSVVRSAMRQAIRWRLLIQDPTDGAQLPRLGRREMRMLTGRQGTQRDWDFTGCHGGSNGTPGGPGGTVETAHREEEEETAELSFILSRAVWYPALSRELTSRQLEPDRMALRLIAMGAVEGWARGGNVGPGGDGGPGGQGAPGGHGGCGGTDAGPGGGRGGDGRHGPDGADGSVGQIISM